MCAYKTKVQHCLNKKIGVRQGNNISHNFLNILSVNEKLPVSKFLYFGKYIMQLFGYCYVHVSGQRQADLER